MPRPRRDGTPAREARKQKLPDRFVRTIKAESAAFAVWDTYQRGLACRVQPTGQKSRKTNPGGRPTLWSGSTFCRGGASSTRSR